MKTLRLFVSFLFCSCIYILSHGQTRLSQGDHFAQINGIRIHYYVSGRGPVCLLPSPGWGPSIGYLKSTLKPFEKYFTMVYYDTRISGQSTGPSDTTKYTSKDFMDDMDALRIYLGQQKVWLMGHSAGGFQVLNYGIHHNDHAKGIIVLDGVAGGDSLRFVELTRLVLKRKGQPYYEKGADIILGKDTTNYTLAEMIPLILPFYFHDPGKIKEFLKLDVSQMSEQAKHYSTAAGFDTEYLFPDLGKITVPTLVVVGDDDFVCDKISQADRIVKSIPSSSEIVIKDAGHFCWFEQPDQFYSECSSWLKKQNVFKNN
ncbi:MAG: alpha/beta fold hydrolase [Chitinophagales bacterium]